MKHLVHFAVAGLLAAVLGTSAAAQTDDSTIAIYGGLTVFNNPSFDSVALVEFPFVLNRHQFDFFRADSTSPLEARIFAQVTAMNLQGVAVDSATTYFSARVGSSEEAKARDMRLFNQLSLLLKPGVYAAKLTVIDVVSKREGEIFYSKVDVPAIDREHLTLGAANLAFSITPVSGEAAADRAVRNGYKVLVNPVHNFSKDDSVMYFYGEVYNLAYDPQTKSRYRVDASVLDDSNRVYQDFGYALREKAGNSAVIVQHYDIKGWPAGKYGLNLIVTDQTTSQSDTAFLRFWIVDKAASTDTSVASTPSTDPYDSLTLYHKRALVFYLLTPIEKKTFESLEPTGKENFLRQYWREHDSDPSTSVIENRLDMITRLRFANASFSTDASRSNGWATDRGRIYLIYGPWDERDDVPTPTTGNPFEVWFYRQVQKGLLFVFEDREGNQEPRLVHSNAEGETYNQDWQTVVDEGLYNFK